MKKVALGFVLGVGVAWPLTMNAAWFLTAADVTKMDPLAQTMYIAGAIDTLDSIAETQAPNDARRGNAHSYVTMVRGCLQQRIEASGALEEFTRWAQRQWQRHDGFGPERLSLDNWSAASVLLLRACE